MAPRFHVFLFITASVLLFFGLTRQYGSLAETVKQIGQNAGGGGQKSASSSPVRPSNSGGRYCKWVFDKYESSAYEEEWFAEAPGVQSKTSATPNICTAMNTAKHIEAAKAIVGRTINLTTVDPTIQWTTLDPAATAPLTPADAYMSRMYYKRVCYDEQSQTFTPASGRGVQLIEPLFGMLRDPFDAWCGANKLTMEGYTGDNQGQSKLHIMPQGYAPFAYTTKDADPTEWHSHGIPPWHSSLRPVYNEQTGTAFQLPSNIYIDFGSSYFGKWNKFTAAASGQWFYNMYHSRGKKFDRFVAVEVQRLDDGEAYRQIPDDLVGIYTLMNVGMTMGEDKMNSLEMIKRIVKPEDFFVFKLDIDSAPIEEPIVQSLLADDPENGGASAYIDELMFEHHVNFWPMNGNNAWRLSPDSTKDGDLITSYNLFRDLRRKGIRAHSWP